MKSKQREHFFSGGSSKKHEVEKVIKKFGRVHFIHSLVEMRRDLEENTEKSISVSEDKDKILLQKKETLSEMKRDSKTNRFN